MLKLYLSQVSPIFIKKRLLKFFLYIFIFNFYIQANKIIYITPGGFGQLFKDEITIKLKNALISQDYDIRQANSIANLKDAYLIVCFDVPINEMQYLPLYPKEKLFLVLWEPPTVKKYNFDPRNHQFFSKVLTWDDDLIDNKKYFKFYIPTFSPVIGETFIDFDKKKLCTLVFSNKSSSEKNELYSERLKLINFFEKQNNNDFEFYGVGWNASAFKNYKGKVDNKIDCIKNYKFCIAYENIKGLNGYITEKIIDSFKAGCIPIYLGSTNVEQYIPKDCFIARENFKNDAELYEFMKNISMNQYNEYIKNIKMFLASEKSFIFTADNFAKTFIDTINTN